MTVKNRKKILLHLLSPFCIGAAIGGLGVATIAAIPALRVWMQTNIEAIGLGVAMLWIVGLVVLFLISIILQIIVHEAGHLIFGLLSGYKFVSFRIVSFMIVRSDERLCLRRFDINGTVGQCLMEPPGAIEEKLPYRLYLAGGVMLNLLTATIAILLLFYVNMPAICQVAMFCFCVAGILFASTNGIPMTGVPNDGQSLFLLKKTPSLSRMLWSQLQVNALQTKGVRLKAMPNHWFELPKEADLGNYIIASTKLMQIGRWLDTHDFKKAQEGLSQLNAVGDRLFQMLRMEVACERICIEIVLETERSHIDELFTPEVRSYVQIYSKFMLSRIRLLYAYALLIEGDWAKAAELQSQALRMQAHYPVKGDADSEMELMASIEIIAQERQNKKTGQ